MGGFIGGFGFNMTELSPPLYARRIRMSVLTEHTHLNPVDPDPANANRAIAVSKTALTARDRRIGKPGNYLAAAGVSARAYYQ